MSETSKEVARNWFEEVWNKERRDAIAEMLAPDSTLHEGGEDSRGPEGFYPFFDRMQSTFSNIRITVHDDIAEDDKVCVRWSCRMKHTGSGFGIPPTDKQLQTTGMSIFRVANGKLVEGWQNWDMLGLTQQMSSQHRALTYVAGAAPKPE